MLPALTAGLPRFFFIPFVPLVAFLVGDLPAFAAGFGVLLRRTSTGAPVAGFAAFTAGFGMLLGSTPALATRLIFVALPPGFGVLLRAAAPGIFLIFCHD